MILGIIGGIIGIVTALLAIGTGAVANLATQVLTENGELPAELEEMSAAVGRLAIGSGIGGLIFSIVGLVGAAIVNKNQRLSGILMLIGGILGFVVLLVGYVVPGILLIIGGILALMAKPEAK